MPYSDDQDLEKVQFEILREGTQSWSSQHIEAELIINREIKNNWFKPLAGSFSHTDEFDERKLLNTKHKLVRASVYKVLELAYLSLMNQIDEAANFSSKTKFFRGLYEEEISNVISDGLSYDWDGSGDIDQSETEVASSSPTMLVL